MNFVKTGLLLSALTALFGAVGYLIGGQSGMLIALAIAAATNLFAYWNSDRLALSAHNAVEVDERTAPELVRLIAERPRVVFGTLEAVEQVLAACGWQLQTAFVERLNLDIRQRVAAVGRRDTTLCKGKDGVRHQLVLFQAYHNLCLPHASLRVPLAAPVPTNGTGSATQWQPRTPAMAAGLTDHVWTLRE